MTLEELRSIVREMRSLLNRDFFFEPRLTDGMVEKAMLNIEEGYRQRLETAIGIKRADFKHLKLPKLNGGFMVQTSSNASSGLTASLWSIRKQLRWLLKEAELSKREVTLDNVCICPGCGRELKITVSLS